jgi:general secretion pathway protein C
MALALLAGLLLAAAPPDLALVGLVRAHDPAHGAAILRSDGRTRTLVPGESAFGGKLVAIGPAAVVMDFGGERVEVPLLGDARAAHSQAAPPALRAEAPAEPGPDPSPAAALRVLARADLERRLASEMPRILAETALRPYSVDGRVEGFTLARVPEGSLLADVGLRAGDVLTSINDVAIDGLPTLIGLWPRLQAANELRAVVLRGGQPLVLAVLLR